MGSAPLAHSQHPALALHVQQDCCSGHHQQALLPPHWRGRLPPAVRQTLQTAGAAAIRQTPCCRQHIQRQPDRPQAIRALAQPQHAWRVGGNLGSPQRMHSWQLHTVILSGCHEIGSPCCLPGGWTLVLRCRSPRPPFSARFTDLLAGRAASKCPKEQGSLLICLQGRHHRNFL